MAGRGAMLLVTLALFFLALQSRRAAADLKLDETTCGGYEQKLGPSKDKMKNIGLAGSWYIGWLIQNQADKKANEPEKRRIQMTLEAFFGEGIARPERRRPLNGIRGTGDGLHRLENLALFRLVADQPLYSRT